MATDLVPISLLQSIGSMTEDQTASASNLLKDTITNASHNFLDSSPNLHQAALALSKRFLDPLATTISDEQLSRLQISRRKRKRGEHQPGQDVLRLKQLYVQDFSTDQIWEQSKRILDSVGNELEFVDLVDVATEGSAGEGGHFHDTDPESLSDEEEAESSEAEGAVGVDLEDDPELSDDDLEDAEIEDGEDIELNDEDDLDEEDEDEIAPRSTFTKDTHGLNDGFFSIDDFNRATEFLEQVDARGDPDDGAASDEEDVDWGADPMNQSLSEGLLAKPGKHKPGKDYDGPTFGDADLNAPWSDGDEEEDDNLEMDDAADDNANEIYYKDFFEPPPRARNKTKRRRALPKTQPEPEQEEERIQRTISAVHHDIFSDDDDYESEGSDIQGNQNLSTHERKQKALAEQIRQLEAEAVAKREWTLTGEARAADRPVNSLLEDDLVLDFERIGKPIPEATVATTEAIEDLIKARILARNFDEIPKRRAGIEVGGNVERKRGLVQVDDRKNQQSLAEIYETEYLKATDPNYVDPRDAETKKAHSEIEGLWKHISAKLDALSSWHYRPKPVDMEVRVVTDAPRVQMEDARPAGVGVGAEESGLAPQEVYKVGEELNGKKGDADVVLTSGGAIVARAELTREQKLRRKRREKERIKKKGSDAPQPRSTTENDTTTPAKRNRKADEKKNILEDLRRGNVKVIGNKGGLQDIEGRKAQLGSSGEKSAGGLKL